MNTINCKLSEIPKLVEGELAIFRLEVTPEESKLLQEKLVKDTNVAWFSTREQKVLHIDKKYLFIDNKRLTFSNRLGSWSDNILLVKVDYEN